MISRLSHQSSCLLLLQIQETNKTTCVALMELFLNRCLIVSTLNLILPTCAAISWHQHILIQNKCNPCIFLQYVYFHGLLEELSNEPFLYQHIVWRENFRLIDNVLLQKFVWVISPESSKTFLFSFNFLGKTETHTSRKSDRHQGKSSIHWSTTQIPPRAKAVSS